MEENTNMHPNMGWEFFFLRWFGAFEGVTRVKLMHFKIQPLEKPSYFVCRILFGFRSPVSI